MDGERGERGIEEGYRKNTEEEKGRRVWVRQGRIRIDEQW